MKYISLAEALASNVLKEEYEVLDRVAGDQLVGIEYEPLFDLSGWIRRLITL